MRTASPHGTNRLPSVASPASTAVRVRAFEPIPEDCQLAGIFAAISRLRGLVVVLQPLRGGAGGAQPVCKSLPAVVGGILTPEFFFFVAQTV